MKKAFFSTWPKASILLVLLILSACGQRGPLYLPEEPQEPPVTEQADDQDNEEQQRG